MTDTASPFDPSTQSIDDNRLALLRLKLDMQREARMLFGPERARALWKAFGFPDIDTIAPPQEMDADGLACLGHLAAWEVQGVALRDRIGAAAAAGVEFEPTLMQVGVRYGVADGAPGIYVSTGYRFVEAIYRDTRWRDGRHADALRSLPGVGKGKTLKFGKMPSWALHVPFALLQMV